MRGDKELNIINWSRIEGICNLLGHQWTYRIDKYDKWCKCCLLEAWEDPTGRTVVIPEATEMTRAILEKAGVIN